MGLGSGATEPWSQPSQIPAVFGWSLCGPQCSLNIFMTRNFFVLLFGPPFSHSCKQSEFHWKKSLKDNYIFDAHLSPVNIMLRCWTVLCHILKRFRIFLCIWYPQSKMLNVGHLLMFLAIWALLLSPLSFFPLSIDCHSNNALKIFWPLKKRRTVCKMCVQIWRIGSLAYIHP